MRKVSPSFKDQETRHITVKRSIVERARPLKIYMLFTGREGRIGKNCARGLEYVLETEGTVFPNTDRPRPVNNIFYLFLSSIFRR